MGRIQSNKWRTAMGTNNNSNALVYYGTPGSPPLQAFLAYGKLYSSSYGGVCYAYNDVTGKPICTWGNGGPSQPDNSTYSGFNGPYGVYPTQIQSIDNGVVYLATDEHTVTNPIYVGATLAAINATTGQQIWRLSGYPSEWAGTGSAWAVAAGYLTFFNGYNGEIYSVGRGPSATTVTAPQTAITAGTNVVIQGTVMDTSAGTQQATVKLTFQTAFHAHLTQAWSMDGIRLRPAAGTDQLHRRYSNVDSYRSEPQLHHYRHSHNN